MPIREIILLGLVSAVALGSLVPYLSRRGRSAAAHRFARSVDLHLPSTLVPVIGRRLAVREVAGVGAGLLLGWIGIAVLAGTAGTGTRNVLLVVVVLNYLLGHAAGYGAIAWREATRPVAADGPRVARATVAVQADYVAPLERIGARWIAAASALVAVGVVLADRSGWLVLQPLPGAWVGVAVVLPAALVLAYELVAARLLREPQPARSTLELAWDDAMRARTLRDMLTVPMLVGAYAPVALLAVIGDRIDGSWPRSLAFEVVHGAIFLIVLGLGALALASLAVRPHRHFRARLWPTPVGQEHS